MSVAHLLATGVAATKRLVRQEIQPRTEGGFETPRTKGPDTSHKGLPNSDQEVDRIKTSHTRQAFNGGMKDSAKAAVIYSREGVDSPALSALLLTLKLVTR